MPKSHNRRQHDIQRREQKRTGHQRIPLCSRCDDKMIVMSQGYGFLKDLPKQYSCIRCLVAQVKDSRPQPLPGPIGNVVAPASGGDVDAPAGDAPAGDAPGAESKAQQT